ncbi:MAG: hypothetical protein VX346_02120 [Planctomycetota bacterium]|nr:hypothetical protein [Planctomycetota bacterium]
MKRFIRILHHTLFGNGLSTAEPLCHVGIEVTSPLPTGNVPIDPTIAMTHHGLHPWVGDLDAGGPHGLLACIEWSVYPFYSHNADEMPRRPSFATRSWTTRVP